MLELDGCIVWNATIQ